VWRKRVRGTNSHTYISQFLRASSPRHHSWGTTSMLQTLHVFINKPIQRQFTLYIFRLHCWKLKWLSLDLICWQLIRSWAVTGISNGLERSEDDTCWIHYTKTSIGAMTIPLQNTAESINI